MIPQVARPALSAVSKSSIFRTVSVRAFNTEEPKYQLEQVHHQVAPLTDSTLYAPHGNVSMETSAVSPTTTTEPIFTPSVNAVFDE